MFPNLKHVVRIHPVAHEWKIIGAAVVVFDEAIAAGLDPKSLKEHLVAMGMYIGFGRLRPERGGQCGRFRIENFATKP